MKTLLIILILLAPSLLNAKQFITARGKMITVDSFRFLGDQFEIRYRDRFFRGPIDHLDDIVVAIAIQRQEKPDKSPRDKQPDKQIDFYNVQIASFRESSRAEKEALHWQDKGFNAYVNRTELGSNLGTWHRVYIGPFGHKGEAVSTACKIREQGFNSYVVPFYKRSPNK